MAFDLAGLTKPATVLIEKISEAIGAALMPRQIKRIAAAQAEAEMINAIAHMQISEIQERGLQRFIAEQGLKQLNMESITMKALSLIDPKARPDNMENDWIANFFDKARLISDDEMQILWAKVLAGEASKPGRYSKRTVNMLASLDKVDATSFTTLCRFCWTIEGEVNALILDIENKVYTKNGLSYGMLHHLDSIGLLRLQSLAGYRINIDGKVAEGSYFDRRVAIAPKGNNNIDIGMTLFSQPGAELATIAGASQVPDFFDYVLARWASKVTVEVLA